MRIITLFSFLFILCSSAYCQIEVNDCKCERLKVFLTDPDTSGTNMREMPNGLIIKVVKNDSSPMVELYVMFKVCNMQGDWLFVTTMNYPEEITGWIHNSVVSSTLAAYTSPISILEHPAKDSRIIDRVEVEQYVKILESNGLFSKIEYTDNQGDIKKGFVLNAKLCGNPYTTCN